MASVRAGHTFMQCTRSILNLSHTPHFSSTRGKKYGCTWLCLTTRRYQYTSLTLPCGQQTEAGVVKTSKEAILQNVAQNTPCPCLKQLSGDVPSQAPTLQTSVAWRSAAGILLLPEWRAKHLLASAELVLLAVKVYSVV